MSSKKLTSDEINSHKRSFEEMTLVSLNDQMMRNASCIRQADGNYDVPEVAKYIHINTMIQWEINRRLIFAAQAFQKTKAKENFFWDCNSIHSVLERFAKSSWGTVDLPKAFHDAEIRMIELGDKPE